MKIGLIGLGRMGKNLSLNIAEKNYQIVVYNRTKEKIDEIIKENSNIHGAYSLKELKDKLDSPRIIWLMVPSGKPTEEMINELTKNLDTEILLLTEEILFIKIL